MIDNKQALASKIIDQAMKEVDFKSIMRKYQKLAIITGMPLDEKALKKELEEALEKWRRSNDNL